MISNDEMNFVINEALIACDMKVLGACYMLKAADVSSEWHEKALEVIKTSTYYATYIQIINRDVFGF